MDKKTIMEMNMYKELCTPNNGQARGEMVQLEMIQETTHNDPDKGELELTTIQLHGVKDTYGNMWHGQTTLIERSGVSPATRKCEVLNDSITDARTHRVVAKVGEEQRGSGLKPVPDLPPPGTPSQPIKDNMTGEEVDQPQIRGESLVAVLIIKEEELWCLSV